MLRQDNTGLIIVDIQGKLATLVQNSDQLIDNAVTMVKAARILGIPTLWLEQIPDKLGRTVDPLRDALDPLEPIAKTSFGGCGEPRFIEAVENANVDNWLICGIETHICVYQTALGLIHHGYGVEVVTDGTSSRDPDSKAMALAKMSANGVGMTGVEMALYELMGDCQASEFRDVLTLIK
ncbi:hydrolase [Tamilnaduibacter salinus]|uniref:Hydrolase n=1 Tax=Tamilnaduibacter salinus TaxID=1484056 RepID=A0A2A2I074_9GAMM|nr:hydrolase [Tamilnaduibacter salinus]PAV25109.1 hydrolase [Tamilnaduibacter salinus]